jgi:hypothetical protein
MKNIKGYENKYYLDTDGNVYRYVIKRKSLKQLKPMNQCGYLAIDLGLNGVIKRHLVHRLMAINYIENPENKPQVNHINGIKSDNRLINLEWNTRSENQLHSILIGLRTTVGEKNSQAKLNEEKVLQIFKDKRLYKEIKEDYKVSIPTISDIKRGYSWTHITGLKNLKSDTDLL